MVKYYNIIYVLFIFRQRKYELIYTQFTYWVAYSVFNGWLKVIIVIYYIILLSLIKWNV